MQSQQDHTQRRIPSAHPRYPTSSSSLGASDSFPTVDSQQSHTQQQHDEAQASLQRRPSQRQESTSGSLAVAASHLTKLDGVIYHFYTTTANLIIQSRLAHLRPFLLTPPFDALSTEQRPSSSTGTPPQVKLSRWFGLHIPDSDLFKEELRFWRSVTSLLGFDAHDVDPSQIDSASPLPTVPDLIIDVMLDLSNVSGRHEILLLTKPSSDPTHSPSHPPCASGGRVCIDGRQPGEDPSAQAASRPRRIVLERWRLRLSPIPLSSSPELSTFYKRSVVHFRALFTLLCSLPANGLAAKVEALKALSENRSTTSPSSFPSLAARHDLGSHDAEMTIGCRLSMASGEEHTRAVSPEEVDVAQALPPEKGHRVASLDEIEGLDAAQTGHQGHCGTRTMESIATPIGHLELSVSYRKLTGFSIEDAESLRTVNDITVDLDEDYFKAVPKADSALSQQSGASVTPTVDVSRDGVRHSSSSHFAAQQRIGGISAARPAVLAAQKSSPEVAAVIGSGAASAGVDTAMSQSPANASVFSTSAPGRHSAGLSSLRRTGSTRSNLSFMGPPNPAGAPSSPALAAALSVEPAFVVPNSVRRSSTSERRLRTLSGLSSGRPSPPISPAAPTSELPEGGFSLPRSTSAAFSTSATARSISTRTTSGFAGMTTDSSGTQSSQPRPSVSFSPSSPSPLAQQIPMQGSRSGLGAAPTSSHTIPSFRSASGSGLRSSLSGTDVLTTPSLRSVFQSYVSRPQTVTSSLISRTPPTSASAFAHGSYSPSNLGTGLRSSSIRRDSSASDAGSGSAFGASVASSTAAAAAAAKPQMIKRYSTNFSYRQNRERVGIYGSSMGSDGSASTGAGAEPSSYPRFGGAGGSLNSPYGRSWVARMEQRQGLGSGGAYARTSSLDDAAAAASASTASRRRPASATSVTPAGGLTPSPRSHDEDMDDLVRLLGSRPAFGTSSMGKLTSLRNERRNAPGLSSTPEEGGDARPAPTLDALTDSVQSNLGQERPSSMSGSGMRSGGGIRTAKPMSRSQLDELLSRMAESVGILASKEAASSASAATTPEPAVSDSAPSRAPASATSVRSLAPRNAPTSQSLTHAQIAATLGKGRGSAGTASTADTSSSRLSSPGTVVRALAGEVPVRSRSAAGNQMRSYGTAATGASSSSTPGDSAAMPSKGVDAPASASAGSLLPDHIPDYEAEGDLIFKADGQPEYDPEDELPGEMEMMPEEGGPDAAARSGEVGSSAFGGGVEGGMGATLPVGAHREGRTHDWRASERWERQRAQEAERKRADAEMSRNFGQEVGASTRGRGSHSPWRAGAHTSAPTTGLPMSLQGQPTTGAGTVGFRSSSSRPLTGTNRLMGVGVGATALSLAPASADGRRGYGVSAPSTHFHYQPEYGQDSKGATHSDPGSGEEDADD